MSDKTDKTHNYYSKLKKTYYVVLINRSFKKKNHKDNDTNLSLKKKVQKQSNKKKSDEPEFSNQYLNSYIQKRMILKDTLLKYTIYSKTKLKTDLNHGIIKNNYNKWKV